MYLFLFLYILLEILYRDNIKRLYCINMATTYFSRFYVFTKITIGDGDSTQNTESFIWL